MSGKYSKILGLVFFCIAAVFICKTSYAEDDLGNVYIYRDGQESVENALLCISNAREFKIKNELFVEVLGQNNCITQIVAQTDLAELRVGDRIPIGDIYICNRLLPAKGFISYDEYRQQGIVKKGTVIEISQPGEYNIYAKTIQGEILDIVLYAYEADKDVLVSNVKVIKYGHDYKVKAYNIDGNNYIRLSELGEILADTEKRFYYYVNKYQQCEVILAGNDYFKYNKEQNPAKTTPDKAYRNNWKFYYSDSMFGYLKAYDMSMYFVGNENFVKLRDVAKMLDLGIEWNAQTNEVVVDINASYT